jgi:hypothetical protein
MAKFGEVENAQTPKAQSPSISIVESEIIWPAVPEQRRLPFKQFL